MTITIILFDSHAFVPILTHWKKKKSFQNILKCNRVTGTGKLKKIYIPKTVSRVFTSITLFLFLSCHSIISYWHSVNVQISFPPFLLITKLSFYIILLMIVISTAFSLLKFYCTHLRNLFGRSLLTLNNSSFRFHYPTVIILWCNSCLYNSAFIFRLIHLTVSVLDFSNS